MSRQAEARAAEPYEISALLFGVTERLRAAFEAVAADFGLTAPQARALLRLHEPLPMGALADHLRCDASNVTGIADRLEGRGLVSRVGGSDRRVKLLAPTTEGKRVRERLERSIYEASPVMTRLRPAQRVALREILAQVLRGDARDDDTRVPN